MGKPTDNSDLPAQLRHVASLIPQAPKDAFLQARAIAIAHPMSVPAVRLMAAALRRAGDKVNADKAALHAVHLGQRTPAFVAAAAALSTNDVKRADELLRAHLIQDPKDAAALQLFAGIAMRARQHKVAETLLRKALAIAPSFQTALIDLATLLDLQNRPNEALTITDEILKDEPDNFHAQSLKVTFLERMGRIDEALEITQSLLSQHPDNIRLWINHVLMLKSLGRVVEAEAVLRQILIKDQKAGVIWWGLAELKTTTFSDGDVEAMEAALALANDAAEQAYILFALGKAYEDRRKPEISFKHYRGANDLRRRSIKYDPAATTGFVEANEAALTKEFFEARRDYGHPTTAPIFIVGMHRAGSSLLEQILASHWAVEGLSELPQIRSLVLERLAKSTQPAAYISALEKLNPDEAVALGQEYLDRVAGYRRTDRPHFVDKMPGNWRYIGFIKLILPNAKIIDIRRHPMDCCFSNYKQRFHAGQEYSYDLQDLGHYYRDYVRAMSHFDKILPGSVRRVIFERLISDAEDEIRGLLTDCGLGFEPACLNFFETDRPVRTPSAGQVRQPVNRERQPQWRMFEPWLGPLKEALSDTLTRYPEAPERM